MLETILLYMCLPGLALLAVYTLYMSRKHRMLQKLGIPGPTPWPVLGTLYNEMKEGFFYHHVKAYQKYKGHKAYYGYFGPAPIIYPRDLDMIRDICIKHFNQFPSRLERDVGRNFHDSIVCLTGEDWKRVRSMIRPAFSSGRLKRMVSLVQGNAGHLVQYLREQQASNVQVELQDCMSRFTMDSLASIGFGVSINSFSDIDNAFAKEGKQLIDGYNSAGPKVNFLDFMWPVLKKLPTVQPIGSLDFFRSFVDQALDQRREDTVGLLKRNDFVQLVLEAQEEERVEGKKMLTESEIQANATMLLIVGYDTTATALSYITFLLAVNPEWCKKVQEEIDQVLQGEVPDYENVQKLTQLDMCINESLRMFSPGFVFDRICNEEIEIQGVKFPKDVIVLVPVCGIHHDPEIYPEPEKFIPERFTAEEKAKRHPFAFLPFGQGPRNCIGMRLALLTLKIGLVSVLQVMTPVACDKTVYPPRVEVLSMHSKDGLWVKMEPRMK